VVSSDAALEPTLTRVLVNQHRKVTLISSILVIEHTEGILRLTPDHVLLVDGSFVAANRVKVGSLLGHSARVLRIQHAVEDIVNPVTSNGFVLAGGDTGSPVVASAYPEWIASHMLTSSIHPLPFSFANLLSFLFPISAQNFYDVILEPCFLANAANLKYFARLPSQCVVLLFIAIDVLVAVYFFMFLMSVLSWNSTAVAPFLLLLCAVVRTASMPSCSISRPSSK